MKESMTPARLSDLIGMIYDCALSPERWPVAMEEIRRELDCELSSMNLQLLPSGESIVNVTTNLAPHFVAIMARSGAEVIEQWGGEHVIRTLPLDQPAVLSHVNPLFNVATTQNRYYHEFAKPQGLIDVLSMGLARDEQGVGSLSFGRHTRAGPFGQQEIEIARLLLPHVQRAATINRLLDYTRDERDTFADTVDGLARPVVLVGHGLRIVHANKAAVAMLADGSVSVRNADHLRVMTPGVTRALAAAVEGAARYDTSIGRKGLGVPLRSADGPAGSIYVLPVGRMAGRHGSAVAAVFFTDLRTAFVPPTELAASLFDLTPSEQRVFDQLAAGRSVSEAARALGIASSTVKTHMLRLYDKMGVSRRTELVRIAAAMALPVIV